MIFFWDFFRRHFSFPRIHILIMASYPSRRGSNFCCFFGLGLQKTTIFWEFTFVRNNCIFSDAAEPVQNKFPKKVTFFGNFPGCIFHHVSFSWLCFYTVLSGWSTTSGWASEKTSFIFSDRKNECLLAPSLLLRRRIPYLSANRLEPRISRN